MRGSFHITVLSILIATLIGWLITLSKGALHVCLWGLSKL